MHPKAQTVHFFPDPIHWLKTTLYLGVTLDTKLTQMAHVKKTERKAAKKLAYSAPSLTEEVA
jgi:hypothetical protein